ncbi:hypothetical protein 2 [Ginkgo biloba sobemo-like virus]|nr:hypothetical protein 2 [Ginkgo biloba sobemo-like virus]
MRLAKTNADLFAIVGKGFIAELAWTRFVQIMALSLEDIRSLTPNQLVELNLVDPVRLFVKNELHSKQKIQEGRYRLISSISVVDSIIERLLNRKLNNHEIDNWMDIPSKPGMGLHDDGLSELSKQFHSYATPMGTDISAFDWKVQQWMLDDDAMIRAELQGCDPEPWLKRAALLGYSVLVLTDGRMYEQMERGIQKSGSYNTSSTNSRIRTIVCHHAHAAVGTPLREVRNCAMGDDCVEDVHSYTPRQLAQLERAYGELGLPLKETEVGCFEFCAYRYSYYDIPRPTRAEKMFLNFLYRWPADRDFPERFSDLENELRHCPVRDRYLTAVLWYANAVA